MRQIGNRLVKVKKAELIEKIKQNKENHVKMFRKAIVAYKKVALTQLEEQIERVDDGALDAKLNLITPQNRESEYDKLLVMFEMEVEEFVELEQREFNQYVHDEFNFAIEATMSNMAYIG